MTAIHNPTGSVQAYQFLGTELDHELPELLRAAMLTGRVTFSVPAGFKQTGPRHMSIFELGQSLHVAPYDVILRAPDGTLHVLPPRTFAALFRKDDPLGSGEPA
jgi:hypothetical protein